MIRKILHLMIPLLLFLPATNIKAQTVELIITGIRNTKGQILIGVFKDNENFQREMSFQDLKFEKTAISNGELRDQFRMEPGVYGLTLLDDENSDEKMEYNFLGIPKEGFGFSDYYHKGLTKPKFDSFKFSIDKGQTKKITIRVRYI